MKSRVNNMSMAQTVIFDFDGTLVDSFALSLRLSNAMAPLYGFKIVRDEDVPTLKNMSAKELFKYLEFPVHKLPLILARGRQEMRKEMASIKLFKGMGQVLERLKSAGVQLGIVTSNSKRNVLECLSLNEVLGQFDFIHSATNLFGKHRILNRLLKKKGLDRETVIYVGDEARDIEASKKCKIRIIAVTWGFQSKAQLAQMNPDYLAETPGDIEKFVLNK